MGPLDPPTQHHLRHILTDHSEEILLRWEKRLNESSPAEAEALASNRDLRPSMLTLLAQLRELVEDGNHLKPVVDREPIDPGLFLRGEEAIGEIATEHLPEHLSLHPGEVRQKINALVHQMITGR